MPKPSPSDGTTTASDSSIAALDRRHVAEEAHRLVEAELAREILEPVLEHAAAGDVEPRVGPLVEHLRGTRAAARRGP